jgi:hypothetical protein
MEPFGCVSLATALMRMRRMSREDRAALNDEIQRILECGPQVGPPRSDRRTDPTLPFGLREWLLQGAGAGPLTADVTTAGPSSGRPFL